MEIFLNIEVNHKYLYNDDKNYTIFITDETLILTPYTFMENGGI